MYIQCTCVHVHVRVLMTMMYMYMYMCMYVLQIASCPRLVEFIMNQFLAYSDNTSKKLIYYIK